jgi:hypothetical protein
MAEHGFEYIFADDWPVRTAPKILEADGKDIVQFPLFNLDDIKIIVEKRVYDNDLIFAEYIRDMDAIFSLGGLYMFDFHSHVLVAERHIKVIRDIISHLEPLNVWKTNCLGMSDWWKERESVEFTVLRKTGNFIEIEAVNTSEERKASGISFTVWFPARVSSARPETAPGEKLTEDFSFLGNRAVIVLPELEPLEEFGFRVLWEN